MMTRRHFVGALAAVAAVGGTGLGGLLARRRRVHLPGMMPADLESLAGQAVILQPADGRRLPAIVRNVATRRTRASWGTPATEQISLLIQTEDRDTPAGRYRIEGEDLVLGELHLSPVGAEGRDRRLEAAITRIV
mgnify:CR=1 FL=1